MGALVLFEMGEQDYICYGFYFSPQTLICFIPYMMNKKQLLTDTNIRNTFYSGVGIGISANSFLLLFHIFNIILGHRPKLTDLPIGLLVLLHLLMLLTNGFIATDIFMPWEHWDDITCKSLIYLYRVLKGLSVCTICLLSVLQAITLSPRTSCLAKFKHNSPEQNLYILLFLCVFYTSISSHLFISIIATSNLTSDNLMYLFNATHISMMLTFREVLFMSLMVLSSVYMKSQHLQGTRLFPKASSGQSIISYSRTVVNDHPILYCIQILTAHSYATVSPLVFISTEKCTVNFSRSL
uniref:Vomeronasal type-1 receptor n=1 Tax=Nannospalax galili TaxID=1026970 RepID=A0A8C6QQK8_NANGA